MMMMDLGSGGASSGGPSHLSRGGRMARTAGSSAKAAAAAVWRNVTVEPVVVCFFMASGLKEVIRSDLLMDKACYSKLHYNATVCGTIRQRGDGDDDDDAYLIEVQKAASGFEANLNLAATFPRVFFALAGGAWSDKHGRKAIIALPILGLIVANLSYIMTAYFMDTLPFETMYAELITDLTGNFILFYLGLYSYMADVTTPLERTFRMALLDGLDYVSSVLGNAISVPLFRRMGYYSVFFSSLLLATCDLLYTLMFVKESVKAPAKEVEEPATSAGPSQFPEEAPACGFGSTGLSPEPSAEHHLGAVGGGRQGGQRWSTILLLCLAFTCFIFAYNGTEGQHRYLFANLRYGWAEDRYTSYMALSTTMCLVNLLAIVPLLSIKAGLPDWALATLAGASGSLGALLPVTSSHPAMFYAGGVVGALSPMGTVSIRSMATACVAPGQVGWMMSIFSFVSAVSSSAITSAYQVLYAATLSTFPATFLVINAALFAVTVIINSIIGFRKMSPPPTPSVDLIGPCTKNPKVQEP